MRELRYAALFSEDQEVDVWVAELPGVGGAGQATQADTLPETREMARDLIDSYITLCLRQDEDPMDPQEALPEGEGWEWVYPSQRVALAWQIRCLRRDRGMTQKQVAEALGVAQETYTRWENPEKMNAKIETLEKLARVFGGHLRVFFDTPPVGRRSA
jgi:antitoxin HicB